MLNIIISYEHIPWFYLRKYYWPNTNVCPIARTCLKAGGTLTSYLAIFRNNLTSPVPHLRGLCWYRSVKQETTNSGKYFEVVAVEKYCLQNRSRDLQSTWQSLAGGVFVVGWRKYQDRNGTSIRILFLREVTFWLGLIVVGCDLFATGLLLSFLEPSILNTKTLHSFHKRNTNPQTYRCIWQTRILKIQGSGNLTILVTFIAS
jgi:hypothetical protein